MMPRAGRALEDIAQDVDRTTREVDETANEMEAVAEHVHEEIHRFKQQGYVSLKFVVLGREWFEVRVPFAEEKPK